MPMARSTPAQKPRGLARRTSMGRSTGKRARFYPAASPLPAARFPRRPSRISSAGADRDRGVGDVERRKVPAAGVQQHEVDDVSELDAVPEVPDRAAEDEREPGAEQPLPRVAQQEPSDQRDRGDRDHDEEGSLPAARAGEEAERGAGVEDEHEVGERDDRNPLTRRERRLDERLRRLVGGDDDGRDREPRRELPQPGQANRRVSPAPVRFETQRPQSDGCAASAPTSAR